ncbi:MAG: class A beta-lactamase-related serine hydrolase [Chitinophagaceae bacterium]|nr:MAG: class A beta-lactamase-related serine hydrolase [Chitinophagaceae bacterium]
MLRFFLFLSITAYLLPALPAQTPSISASKQKALDSVALQDVPPGAPGIATAIVDNGVVTYRKTGGFANLDDSSLITMDSRFNIASNGKQFTALAILLLADRSKIRLTDDIRKYLPGLYPGVTEKITIENLVTHTSGIRDVYDLWSLQGLTWWQHSFSNKDVFDLVAKQQDLNFRPGSSFLYSNTNYILLAMLIEKVSGMSFVAYTNGIFHQLGMPNSSFENDYTAIRGPVARAYFNFGTWTTYNWIWNVCGDGNIFSSLKDQVQWEQLLQGYGNTEIPRAILDKSQRLTGQSSARNYGYGLETGDYKRLPYRFHEGATGAWKATVVRFPEKKVSMLTLTNTGKSTPDRQTRQMADIYFDLPADAGKFPIKPLKAGIYVSEEDVEGIYMTPANFTFQFEKRDSVLYLKRAGRNDILLEREAANIFHQAFDPDFKQEFVRNEKGELEVTAYYTSHAPYTLSQVKSNWTGFDPGRLNGTYLNSETGVTITISLSGGRNYDVKIGDQDSTKGLMVSPTKLLVDNYVLEFDGKNGPERTFLLSANRIKKVMFLRMKE